MWTWVDNHFFSLCRNGSVNGFWRVSPVRFCFHVPTVFANICVAAKTKLQVQSISTRLSCHLHLPSLVWSSRISHRNTMHWSVITLMTGALLLCIDCVSTIRVKSVRFVPRFVKIGDDVDVICVFELLPNERIYSLKWYKEEEEFFRFEPKSNRSFQTFSAKGINLDVSNLV